MQGIIISAGSTYEEYNFPPNSKPKCLFHVKGEIILERQVRIMREKGIEKIRIVTGYRGADIEQFNAEKNLNLEIVHDESWRENVLNTFLIALNGIEDDVLIVNGDVILTSQGLDNVLQSPKDLVMLHHGKDSGYDIFKASKHFLPVLRTVKKFDTDPEKKLRCIAQGYRLHQTLKSLFMKNGAVSVDVGGVTDIDYYRETDEYFGR